MCGDFITLTVTLVFPINSHNLKYLGKCLTTKGLFLAISTIAELKLMLQIAYVDVSS
jgi:hypothetical protein